MQGPNGVAYTRNGTFSIDAKGQLVTAEAQPVLDDGGRPITVGEGKASIAPDGRVSVDGRQIAKLALTALDPTRLHKLGDNLYREPSRRARIRVGSNRDSSRDPT